MLDWPFSTGEVGSLGAFSGSESLPVFSDSAFVELFLFLFLLFLRFFPPDELFVSASAGTDDKTSIKGASCVFCPLMQASSSNLDSIFGASNGITGIVRSSLLVALLNFAFPLSESIG